jgi:hypothetical protein
LKEGKGREKEGGRKERRKEGWKEGRKEGRVDAIIPVNTYQAVAEKK